MDGGGGFMQQLQVKLAACALHCIYHIEGQRRKKSCHMQQRQSPPITVPCFEETTPRL